MSFLNDTFVSITTGADLNTSTDVAWVKNTSNTSTILKGANGLYITVAGSPYFATGSGQAPSSPNQVITGVMECVNTAGSMAVLFRSIANSGVLASTYFYSGYSLDFNGYYRPRLFRYDSSSPVQIDAGTLLSGSLPTGYPVAGQNIAFTITVSGSTITVQTVATGASLSSQNAAMTATWAVTDATYALAGVLGIVGVTGDTATTGMQLQSLNGTTPAAPTLGVTGLVNGGTYNFGNVGQSSSQTASFTLTDTGAASLTLATVTVGSGVTLTTDPSGNTYAPAGTGTLALSISTATLGAFASTVTIPSNDSGSPFIINLTANVTTTTPPSAPTSPTASTLSGTSILVGWTNPGGNNQSGFKVERSPHSAGTFTQIGTTTGSIVTYTDTGLTGSTTYDYRIRATNAYGDSAYTSIVSGSTAVPGAPPAPTNLVATVITDDEVMLTWDRSDDTDTAAVIERSTDGGSTWGQIGLLGAHENVYRAIYLWPATAYMFRVKMRNGSGDSGYILSSSVTTLTTAAFATANLSSGVAGVSTSVVVAATDAWTVNVSFTDVNGLAYFLFARSADGGLTWTPFRVYPGSGGPSYAINDKYLTPGATYLYRYRGDGLGSIGPIMGPYSVTMPARPTGIALEPTNLVATQITPLLTRLTWTDNSGGTASYKIQSCTGTYTGFETFGTIATTTVGATSYDLTTTAQTFFNLRVTVTNGSGDGGSTPPLIVRTASAGTGSPKVYNIGTGKTYATVGALDWTIVGPGDTVNIYPKLSGGSVVPYFETWGIACRGLPSSPININFLPDSTSGLFPIFDGAGATTNAQFVFAGIGGGLTYATTGVLWIGTRGSDGVFGSNTGTITGGGVQGGILWAPGWLNINGGGTPGITGAEFRNGKFGQTAITDSAGVSRSWSYSSAGIYFASGENITLSGVYIHGNGNGLFGACGKSTYDTAQELIQKHLGNITIRQPLINQNCNIGRQTEHNVYFESDGVLYDNCEIGPPIYSAGLLVGNALKDRSNGAVIKDCRIIGGAHSLDLIHAQNHAGLAFIRPDYQEVQVYGNEFYNPSTQTGPGSNSIFHLGGDTGDPFIGFRRGLFRFYDNTYCGTQDSTASGTYGGVPPFIPKDNATGRLTRAVIDVRNMVFQNIIDQTLTPAPFCFGVYSNSLPLYGYFGKNWVLSGYTVVNSTGYLAGMSNIITGTDPKFVSATTQDYRLASGSALIDAGGTLGGGIVINTQYLNPRSYTGRTVVGSATDIGAHEYATGSIAVSPTTIERAGTGQVVTIVGTTTAFSGSPFTISSGSITGQTITDTTHATVTITAPSVVGSTILADTGSGGSVVLNVTDTIAPTIVSAAVSTDGSTLTVTFSEAVTGTTAGGYSLSAGHARTLGPAVGSGSTRTFSLSPFGYSGETYTLAYTATLTNDLAGNPLATVSGISVTNASTVAAQYVVPTTPTGLAVTPGIHSNAVAWSASTATSPSTIAGYRVYRGATLAGVTASTTFSDTGQTAGVSLTYTIVAVDSYGNGSTATAGVAGTPLPSLPGSATTPTAGTPEASVVITWSAVSGATSYKLYRDGALLAAGITSLSYTDTSAIGSHVYKIAGSTADGDGAQSGDLTIDTGTATYVTSGGVGSHQIKRGR